MIHRLYICGNCFIKDGIIQQYIKQHRQEVDALKTRIKVLQWVTRMDKEKCTPFSHKYMKTDEKKVPAQGLR